MKLGINTAFIMTFDVEEGLRFASNLGMHVAEVATCGIAFNNNRSYAVESAPLSLSE